MEIDEEDLAMLGFGREDMYEVSFRLHTQTHLSADARDKYSETRRLWELRNKDKRATQKAAYKKPRSPRLRKYTSFKEYRLANPEAYERDKQMRREYYQRNKARLNANRVKWAAENRDKVNAARRRHRQKKRGAFP